MSQGGSGKVHLARRSDLNKVRQGLPDLSDVLIVEDERMDADRLQATLRLMYGYDLEVRRAATLGSALDCVLARHPQIVFLDDVLKPSDDASQSIPFIRRAGYQGPIVVISGQVTRQRRLDLLAAGASEVIHKDDVNSVRVAEALATALASVAAKAGKD